MRNARNVSPTPPPVAAEPLRWEWVARVWERMIAAFPGRWILSMGASPHPLVQGADGRETVDTTRLTMAGETWSVGLAGLTGQQLGVGLQACMTSWAEKRIPSLAEFRGMCLGIPKISEVREDIMRAGEQRNPFTILVCRHLDYYAWRHADARDADRMLWDAYDRARDAVMKGAALPDLPPALPSCKNPQATDAKLTRSPEVALAALHEIAEMLGKVKNDAA